MLKDSLKISKFKSNKHKYLQLKNKHKICISVGTNHKGLAVQQKFLPKALNFYNINNFAIIGALNSQSRPTTV